MKIAFVVQRYGLEVNGGAELLCRLIAEHMSIFHEVEIITTCAKDYYSWKNEYKSGLNQVNGITVRRYPVDKVRKIEEFCKMSAKLFSHKHSYEDEINWMKNQGPFSTELFDFIKNNTDKYDFFIFFTYLYCTTFFGLPLVENKAILVPTAHNEPPIYLSIFKSIFKVPRAIIYNTEEEKIFVNSMFSNNNIESEIIGVGVEVPKKVNSEDFRYKYKQNDFIIYAGRIDEAKGCRILCEYFIQYKKETKSKIKLIFLGKQEMKIPKHPDIIPLGFVSEQDKFNGIKASKLLVMPSKYESLSIVLLESWLCDNPVLVNGKCDVLKGQCIRSNGGLYYTNYDEFRECLNLLLGSSQLREKMGKNGRRYVEKNYSWDIVESKYLKLLEKVK